MSSDEHKKKVTLYYYEKERYEISFEPLAKENYDVIVDQKNPQIVLASAPSIIFFHNLAKVRRNYGYSTCIVSYTGENIPPNRYVDYSISLKSTNSRGKNFQLLQEIDKRMTYSRREIEELDLRIDKLKVAPKDKFCNFVYRNDFSTDTRFRREFCQLLSDYKSVDCPSKSLNNMPLIGGAPFDKLTFISKYKFTIAFENTLADHYVTEKIIHPLSVGSVPIYWGCPQISEYYNPESFINCHDYDSFEDVVEHVKEVDNNPELYNKYLNASQVLPSSRLNKMTKEAFRDYVNLIVEDALSRKKYGPIRERLMYHWWLFKNLHRYINSLWVVGRKFIRMKIKRNITK